MAVTRSSAAERAPSQRALRRASRWRTKELIWTIAAILFVAFGLYLVYRAKASEFPAVAQSLAAKKLIDLNNLSAREDLLPALTIVPDARQRQEAARRIYYLSGGLSNVGAVARERGLLTSEQFREFKPLVVVRSPAKFRRAFLLWIPLFFAGFLLAHAFFSVRGFRGDETFLPALLLLTGIGLILMISLRDPVRDTLLFVDFAQGVLGGCVLLAFAATLDYERLFGNLSFVPLLASFGLSLLLIVFGYGPGTSDAKVNLFGFQPVEIIRLLLVFFLAGYFAKRWDVLRHARERRPSVVRLTRHLDIPPLEYTIPVLACVLLSLVFFFLQKDMGPALVFACLFLVLYGVARGSAFVPLAGLVFLGAGFLAGFVLGVPHTVRDRVSMWFSPWDNMVHGGDQLAHSLWAFATGGVWGTGIGLGDPQIVPAAHTDLILSALGEEWGFIGVLAVFALFGLLLYKSLRIALRARTDYEFFLATGLTAATALQILLISGGALGVLPLSGVVTPFLSYGRTAMLANFLLVAILLSISARASDETDTEPFRVPVKALGAVFGMAGLVVVAKAAYVQALHSPAVMGQGTLVVQADGARRYQYNPRFSAIMREIPKGSIYDRNGLPLASSNWDELEKHRQEYQQLGIDIGSAGAHDDARHYPFGSLMFDLLGDVRTRARWGATNTSLVERDSASRLRGYDDRAKLLEVRNPKTGRIERVIRYDYRELVPLLRHRYEPDNSEVRRVLDRPRDVRLSIDARLEVRVAAILREQLQKAGRDKGAAVVMDSATGDLLAAVSYPLPPDNDEDASLDRARYGLYPPGSTFKVVTAMAALRKDPQLAHRTYECIRLPDGRVGNYIKGSKRPIRDDIEDKTPHGTEDMEHAIVVSCNAYFAQFGTYDVGAQALWETAQLLGIAAASPNTSGELKKSLPQSSYGQGEVVASPFQMARVAATIANGGAMPQGRWITDDTNTRTGEPQTVLSSDTAQTLARFMREVVTAGTGRRAAGAIPIAGKTGTAELADAPSHAWFIGFAPYGSASRKIAFSVLIENGVYGGTAAAPAATEIVDAAAKLGLIHP
ncbi:MAG TPA: FtsW/RodA/SpoVE family cell cycle protein [Bryobacteraceae bacterium]|nr:FtsW/RodA/SpoVE family cell cycle protein [Bryobacteraceae bacterium]